MNRPENVCEAFVGFFLGMVLGGCAFAGNGDAPPAVGHDPDSEIADVVLEQQAPETPASTTIPILSAIKVYFKLDPLLTRGVNMGDRWVSPASFTTVRKPGMESTVDARVVGLDARGELLNRHLEADWEFSDSDVVTASPNRGNHVTITLQSPGESTLRVSHGEVSATLTVLAVYEEQYDSTQLVISRESPD